MKITKLEKKKRLYLLELDSDQTCYITEDTIVHFMLTKDKELVLKSLQKFKPLHNFPTEKTWRSTTYPSRPVLKKKSETI